MYELTGERAEEFKRAVRIKLAEKDMSVLELAELVHYSKQSVYNFLSANNWNRFLAAALAEKLEIEGGAFND